jgi:protein ImuA
MGLLRIQRQLTGCADHSSRALNTLSEVFAATASDPASVAFALMQLRKTSAPVLWVQDRISRKETGHPCLAGIGTDHPLIVVNVSRAADVLWAMEDGLRCKALGGVIGEVWGNPRALDFTATKRLALRAEAAETPCWLIRRAASTDLSAARDRWRVASLPSAPHPHDSQAPGDFRWQVELFRSRTRKTGTWVATYDGAADRLNLSAPIRDGAVAARDGAAGQRAAG